MPKYKARLLLLLPGLVYLLGCDKYCEKSNYLDFEFLEGYWVKKDSPSNSLVHFYSESQLRFGLYSRGLAKYDTFRYNLLENSIVLDYYGDDNTEKSTHTIVLQDDHNIEITDLTIIPENPNIVYKRLENNSLPLDATISMKFGELYYNSEKDIRLKCTKLISDSRCPIGAACVWEGNAKVKFELYHDCCTYPYFNLNTNSLFLTDTIINRLRFQLIDIQPKPEMNKDHKYADFTIQLLVSEE